VFSHNLFFPAPITAASHGVLSDGIWQLLRIDSWPLLAIELLQSILMLTTGILISFMMQKFKLINKTTLMPAAVFVLICSYFPEMRIHIAETLCGLCLIILLYKIFGAYNKQRADMVYFDAAIISAIASLIYFPAVIFFFFSLFGLLRMRSTSFREFIIYLSGWLTVAFLLGTYIFWNGSWEAWFASWEVQMHFISGIGELMNATIIAKLSLIGLVFIVTLIFYFDRLSANLIQIRKYMGVFMLLFLFCLVTACLGIGMDEGSLYLLWVPVTVVISYYFFHFKQLWYSEGMHAALLLGTFLFQYLTFA